MVEDAMRRVAMVDVAVEVANAEVAAHEAAGAQGGAKQWWREAPQTKTVMRRGRSEDDNCQTTKAEASTGFARPSRVSGAKAHASVANTGCTRESAQPKSQNVGDQKMSQ